MTNYNDILNVNVTAGYWNNNSDEVSEHLVKIGEVDLAEPDYSFNLIGFWVRKHDGMIMYTTDSGCSCPMPFEDTKVGELSETTLDKVLDVARANAYSDEYGYHSSVVVESVKALIPEMIAAGAK